jgi:SAM-dependent methyltransferase
VLPPNPSRSDHPGTAPLPPAFPTERLADYLDGTSGLPPRELLLRGLALGGWTAEAQSSDAELGRRHALDLGCGPGREVVVLLQRGFRVQAVDPYRSMIDATSRAVMEHAPSRLGRLRLDCARIEELAPALPRAEFDLVHAGFVLPFVESASFADAFRSIAASMQEGGMFVGQFFGPDDEFVREAAPGAMTSHTREEVDALLCENALVAMHREEVRRDGKIGRGRSKFWHVHHVIARRG